MFFWRKKKEKDVDKNYSEESNFPVPNEGLTTDDKANNLDDKETEINESARDLDDQVSGLDEPVFDLDDKESGLDDQAPNLDDKESYYDNLVTEHEGQSSDFDEPVSNLDDQDSDLDDSAPDIDDQDSEHDELASYSDEPASDIDDQESSLDNQVFEIDEQESGFDEPVSDLASSALEASDQTDVPVNMSDSASYEKVDEPAEKKKGFFARLFDGLTKTRNSIMGGLDSIFSAFSSIDDDFYDELEEVMVTSDMGVRTTDVILDKLRERVKSEHIREPEACRKILIDSIREQMDVGPNAYEYENRTSVLLVVGVNGVGKTTSIGKLASQMKNRGKKVLLAAADTFRAGAVEQLAEWSRRAGVALISSGEGADPAAVVFDAVSAAKARKTDILIVDTAGRLHNKKNLMEELRKISRIIDREFPDAYRETLAVVDATTGQNALSQAREFMEVSDVSGIILTKMDGTAKGGIAVAIQSELHLPVKYIGVGEQIDDLQKFDSEQYVNALFGINNN